MIEHHVIPVYHIQAIISGIPDADTFDNDVMAPILEGKTIGAISVVESDTGRGGRTAINSKIGYREFIGTIPLEIPDRTTYIKDDDAIASHCIIKRPGTGRIQVGNMNRYLAG